MFFSGKSSSSASGKKFNHFKKFMQKLTQNLLPAFSQASSSSYTFGGNLNPTDLEALKAQAVAHASAEAVAGSGATAGAVAGATAHAAAGATSSNAVTGSAVSNSGAVASSNAGKCESAFESVFFLNVDG